jgi:acetyl esterase/lipase
VALFVHGGVWAVGEKWQFAPMASRLAEEGVVTCVATYTLFPQVRRAVALAFRV